jgi:hypothetical protein
LLVFDRSVSEHLTARDCERHPVEKFAARGTEDTFSSLRFVRSSVGGTEDVATVFCQELIVYPIHRHRDVTAAVDIGKQLTAVVYEKAFDFSTIELQEKFFRLAGVNFADMCDSDRLIVLH